ncbi:MAG: hypothetical protein M1817_000080 [Caeruleum heppii]|nr:MAG: hypothetical protein M1817_000080 [Caeruleum heppii]
MASPVKPAAAARQQRPRSRKSIAHVPSSSMTSTADQENATVDLSALSAAKKAGLASERASKKSRSKSIGPGGLDALNEGTGNRRKSITAPLPKSILKMPPMSPLKEIPLHPSVRKDNKQSKSPSASPSKSSRTVAPLIDFGSSDETVRPDAPVTGSENLSNPFDTTTTSNEATKVGLKTEEEQQAAVREREQREERERERDIRRKSLANRRVSFAPEATLHTWDVVEYFQDSTTSSASTNSTRRASSASASSLPGTPAAGQRSSDSSQDASEPPSTPPEQVEEQRIAASPAHQRDLHQKKRRRRSSGIPPMNFNNPDEEGFSSSPYSGSSVAGSDDTNTFVDAEDDDESAADSESSAGDASTVMEVDEDDGDTTSHSVASAGSSSSTASSGRLEAALREAAKQAGTQGIEYDEHGDLTMEMADEEVTASFQPFVRKDSSDGSAVNDVSMQAQPNQNPFSPAFKAGISRGAALEPSEPPIVEEDMSMDVTGVLGGIIPSIAAPQSNTTRNRRKSVRVPPVGEDSSLGDDTMDLTMAIGGIQAMPQPAEVPATVVEDEEMTMELTSVIGGVLGGGSSTSQKKRRQSTAAARRTRQSDVTLADGMEMDMTMAGGRILEPKSEQAQVEVQDETVGMDITTAIGAILPSQLKTENREQAKAIMEAETDAAGMPNSPAIMQVHQASARPGAIDTPSMTTASATGSPRKTSARRSPAAGLSIARQSPVRHSGTPLKRPTTPSKQLTPQPPRPTTPGKTPPSKNITFRSASPKRLFKEEIRKAESTPKPASAQKLFQAAAGPATPSIVLTPRNRPTSGLGVDKQGIGSPRVAALLDRRQSIGDDAKVFTPTRNSLKSPRAVRFEDPQLMEREVDKEREEEEKRENGRALLQRKADLADNEDKDATVNLKEMIQSLTPKKKLNGRKSLHVGAARGILGKRPAELDDEDGEGDDHSPKRLRGQEGSPVKKVILPPPPSKIETSGRISRSSRKSLGQTSGNLQNVTPTMQGSPQKGPVATTPKSQGRFKDAQGQAGVSTTPIPFAPKTGTDEQDAVNIEEAEVEEEKIRLQDFLNLTSIRFMELTTTKRRHTVAPKALSGDIQAASQGAQTEQRAGFQDSVVAACSTLPMLELYQHSCRELKNYISEGRSIVREIEAETFEENPALFREYIMATPDVKFIMDNQFKNVKTHARLLSKAMWYEWRMKLLDGLREGLTQINNGLAADDKILKKQEDLFAEVMPSLVETHERLEKENVELQTQADEIADCDQEELDEARGRLLQVEDEVAKKSRMLAEMQRDLEEKEVSIGTTAAIKSQCLDEIRETEKIREECRGWKASEVRALKANVDALEDKYGWTITGAQQTRITMRFQAEVEVDFDTASFLPNQGAAYARKETNSSFDIRCVGNPKGQDRNPLTTEKDFFLQRIRMQLQGMKQSQIRVRDLLRFVSESWIKASMIAEELRQLNLSCPTEINISSERSLSIISTVLLLDIGTKVETVFEVTTGCGNTSVAVNVASSAAVVYGEKFNESKMGEFLAGKVGKTVAVAGNGDNKSKAGAWAKAVRDLSERCSARGKK